MTSRDASVTLRREACKQGETTFQPFTTQELAMAINLQALTVFRGAAEWSDNTMLNMDKEGVHLGQTIEVSEP